MTTYFHYEDCPKRENLYAVDWCDCQQRHHEADEPIYPEDYDE